METAVNCKGVSFTYAGAEKAALNVPALTVSPGEFCLVLGKSGSGKSTLLRLLKKEIRPAGLLVGEIGCAAAGYLSQNVEETLVCDRVRSELSFGLTNRGLAPEKIELRVAEIAAYFNLEAKLDRELSTLSGGEKQLVNLAAVMLLEPDVLLLDEPCAQLDPVATERFVQMLRRLHTDFGCSVLAVSHDGEALYEMADSLLVLEDGRLLIKDEKEAAAAFLMRESLPIQAELPAAVRFAGCGFSETDDKSAITDKKETAAALTAKNITFAYTRDRFVLDRLSLTVPQGKITAVIGANGCGKSTLLRLMAGVHKPLYGKVKAQGNVAMLTQNVRDVFTAERAADEVPFGEITDYLEISHLADRHPYDLSGGEAQRLALAKVLARGADIIILDEPTRGFDALLKQKLGALLRDLCKQGKTVLLASHDLSFCGEYADETAFLSGGRIAAAMPTEAMFRALHFYTTPMARLTGGARINEKQ